MQLVDSHAHVDFPQFDDDRGAVIERAREAGLVAIVNIGTTLASSRASVALAEQYELIYAAVGIHPHDARWADRGALDELRGLAHHPKVVAIGETGLDYYRDYSPRPAQRRSFRNQLALASALGLPVVVHSRDAHEDVLATLRDWGGTGVLHTYAGGPEHLNQVMEMGFSIGISGPVTFADADRLREAVSAVPSDRLLLETDCPYLAPEPHQGKRNEPAYVRYVAEAVARARWEPVDQVADAATENTLRLFGFQ
ncbi:MAG: TatD family hydrolase [Anaerolineae bacterium]|jgi:TatD DNase family protein